MRAEYFMLESQRGLRLGSCDAPVRVSEGVSWEPTEGSPPPKGQPLGRVLLAQSGWGGMGWVWEPAGLVFSRGGRGRVNSLHGGSGLSS